MRRKTAGVVKLRPVKDCLRFVAVCICNADVNCHEREKTFLQRTNHCLKSKEENCIRWLRGFLFLSNSSNFECTVST